MVFLSVFSIKRYLYAVLCALCVSAENRTACFALCGLCVFARKSLLVVRCFMDHNGIRHKLSDYIDGAVTAEEKAGIEAHLKACAQCSTALDELRRTIEQIRLIEEAEPPAWMASKIMAQVREEAGQKKRVFRRLFSPLSIKLPLQTVAVLFLAVTAFYIYKNIQPETRYAESPPAMFEAKKEAPSPGKAKGEAGGPEEQLTKQQAPQSPGYKSLDMRYAYEKPAPPAPQEEERAPAPAAAVPAPEKPADKLEMLDDSRAKRFVAAKERGDTGDKIAAKAKESPAPAAKQETAGRAVGILSETAPKQAATASLQRTACLSYEPDIVSVPGTIREKDFPGPPNYESIEQGDRRETAWILTPEKPVCVTGKSGDDLNVSETDITAMQLVLDPAGYAKYRGLLKKPVVVKGTLFHSHTGHHHTPVLLTVQSITER